MLEIIIIWRLVVHIGRLAEQKGLKKLSYQIMAVLLWLIGEISGSFVGSVVFAGSSSSWPLYGAALVGAMIGASIAFLVMKCLPKDTALRETGVSDPNQIPANNSFGRTVWIPVIVILVAIVCLGVSFGGAVIVQIMMM